MFVKRIRFNVIIAMVILLSSSCSLFQEAPAAVTDAPIQDEPTN